MSFSACYLPAVLLTILSLPTLLWAQAAPKQTKARGSISGRVTIKAKGAEGVVVVLRKSEQMNPFETMRKATTDQDGFYRIADVASGNYEVQPSAPALVPTDLKEQRGKPVLVGEDENVEDINFALVRGGVITGKVTDADGRPVIQQQVNIFRVEVFEQQGQQRQIFSAGAGQTDDRGIYRVFGLMPGRYKVGAGRGEDQFTPGFSSVRSTYKQVFHPDVSDPAKATVIEVGEGTEAKDVDITLGRSLQTYAVAGKLVDEKGLPVPNIRLGLQRSTAQRTEYVNALLTTNSQGDFVAEGLIPGKYGVYLFPNQGSGMRVDSTTFDIIDQDLSGLTFKLMQGASLSGVVVFETDNKAALAKLSELQLRTFVVNPTGAGGMGSSATSPIAPDGSFLLSGLPGGTAQIMIGAIGNPFPPKGFNIARIERDGVASGRGVEIKDGEQVTGLRVVVAYGNATLRGVVTFENGELPPGGRIFVRLAKPGENLSNMRPPQVDARGHFLVEGLAAGAYEVHVSVSAVQGMQVRNVKRDVSVQDGVTTDITIVVDMTPLQKP
jgi:protocatechuate 3,4-dioxygenase beta subunit